MISIYLLVIVPNLFMVPSSYKTRYQNILNANLIRNNFGNNILNKDVIFEIAKN
jgi:hypothetical protein